jgi:hypothetical protein
MQSSSDSAEDISYDPLDIFLEYMLEVSTTPNRILVGSETDGVYRPAQSQVSLQLEITI